MNEAIIRVSKTFYIDTSVIEIIGKLAERDGISESQAAALLIREGRKESDSPKHNVKTCPACRGDQL